MQSYSRQRRHQLGLDLVEGRIYERSLRFYPNQKDQGKKTLLPPSEIIHALRKKEAARSKLTKTPTDQQQQKYRELCAKTKTLLRESREIYFSSLDSDLARQPKRFWSFSKLKNKTRTFPEKMSSGSGSGSGSQASTPQQIAELFNSYFVSVFSVGLHCPLRGSHFVSTMMIRKRLFFAISMIS